VLRGLDAQSIINQAIQRIQAQVGDARVLSAVSGGVDSSVATALVMQAVGDQLSAVFVDTGLMRKDEGQWVKKAFQDNLGANLVMVRRQIQFFSRLAGSPRRRRNAASSVRPLSACLKAAAQDLGHPPFPGAGNDLPGRDRIPRAGARPCPAHQNPS
jgi:GMP synthase (glutamine-hydrolysing)